MALSIYYDGGRRDGGHDESGLWGSDSQVNKGLWMKPSRSTHLTIRKGVMHTYSEIPNDASLQSLSYLEWFLNLGTSE